jgi:DNA-binding transcriptional regulator PaaX
MPVHWLVLIYTLPPEPTRKRAFVWRELKKLGAVYLRDGVCVLPDQPATRQAMQALVERARTLDGQATLVETGRMDEMTAQSVVRQAQAARGAEYAALCESASQFLDHVRRELCHRDFSASEAETLMEDLRKLRRWCDQIRARDYFASEAAVEAEAALTECEATLRDMRVGVVAR